MMWTLRWCPLKQSSDLIPSYARPTTHHPREGRSVKKWRDWPIHLNLTKPIRCCRRHESVAAAWPTLFVAFTPTESILTSGKHFGPVFWDVFKHGAYLYIVRVGASCWVYSHHSGIRYKANLM
jgi:hypothetical protein